MTTRSADVRPGPAAETAAGATSAPPALARPTPLFAPRAALRPQSVPTEVDFGRWVRSIERRRRALAASTSPDRRPGWPPWLAWEATRASFGLDGIAVTDADKADALTPGRPLRSRRARRLRHHLAIVRCVDRRRCPLDTDSVVRWYTSIADGLSCPAFADDARDRLTAAIRRINSPQMRLQPAVLEIARLHAELLAGPPFPGFNGILARLLLHAHLANCGLPPVVFDPATDLWKTPTPVVVANRLLELIDRTLERLSG